MYNYKLLWSPALANLHCVPKKTCDHIFDDKLK